ncbi:MAG: DoxX family protein [Planctomycetia bacterium]|nr:DoxX family protein [Planctomycetia bacterium]
MGKPNHSTTLTQDVALLLIRLIIAIIFLYHGSQKLFGAFGGPGLKGWHAMIASMGMPMPWVSALLSACAEFFGGLIFLLGTGLRLIAVPLAINMMVATWVASKGGFSVMHNGCEYPLCLLVIVIAMFLLGPGRYTIGAMFRGARSAGA